MTTAVTIYFLFLLATYVWVGIEAKRAISEDAVLNYGTGSGDGNSEGDNSIGGGWDDTDLPF